MLAVWLEAKLVACIQGYPEFWKPACGPCNCWRLEAKGRCHRSRVGWWLGQLEVCLSCLATDQG